MLVVPAQAAQDRLVDQCFQGNYPVMLAVTPVDW